MTYAEKLRNPKWQKKRLEILKRDHWACIECFDKEKTLHVHHKVYLQGKEPWDYPDSHLATLCEDCHAKQSAIEKELDRVLLHGLKVNIHDSFVMGCAATIFREEKLHDLIFLIWHLGFDKSLERLNKTFAKECKDVQKKFKELQEDGNI